MYNETVLFERAITHCKAAIDCLSVILKSLENHDAGCTTIDTAELVARLSIDIGALRVLNEQL